VSHSSEELTRRLAPQPARVRSEAHKRGARACRCGDPFSEHLRPKKACARGWEFRASAFYGGEERWYREIDACGCSRFRAAPSLTRGTRRSVKSEAKDAERDFAKALGGRRLPAGVATQQRNGDVDVEGATWKMQVKHMPVPSRWTEAWEQILTACTGTGKYPLVGIKTKPGQGRRSEMYIMVRLDDWVSLNGTDEGENA